MKNIIFKLFVSALILSASIRILNAQTTFTILHVNDSHSHLDSYMPDNSGNKKYGISRIGYIINQTRQSEQNVIALHAGDFMVGDLFFNAFLGTAELRILQMLGFDAVTIGNHELDLGPAYLYGALSTAFADSSLPVLSANLDFTNFPSLANYIHPYTIKNYNGVKVGIFGMTIPNELNNPYPVIVSDSFAVITARTIQQMKSNGANVIIFLSHLGAGYDEEIAANVSGINIIIGGHSHSLFDLPITITNPEGKTTYICQAGSFYHNIGKMKFTYENGNVILNSYEIISTANTPEQPEITTYVNSLKPAIIQKFGNVFSTIGYADTEIKRSVLYDNSPFKDSPLGNIITDSYRNKLHTEIALLPTGLTSESIPKGPITGADLFRAIPYGFDTVSHLGFTLATMNIKGSDLKMGLEVGLTGGEQYFIQVSGMTYTYDSRNNFGARVTSIKINDVPVNYNQYYSCTVNTGVLTILNQLGISVTNINTTLYTEFNVFKEYFSTLNKIITSKGRIKDIRYTYFSVSSNTIPEKFVLKNNYPNPFNNTTAINYECPENAMINLSVYDVAGRYIKTLVNGNKNAGSYTVSFDGRNLSSGIYFCRLSVNGRFADVKKILMVK